MVKVAGARLQQKLVRQHDAADVAEVGSECQLSLKIPRQYRLSTHQLVSINQSINQSITNCLSSRATSRLIVKLNKFWFR